MVKGKLVVWPVPCSVATRHVHDASTYAFQEFL